MLKKSKLSTEKLILRFLSLLLLLMLVVILSMLLQGSRSCWLRNSWWRCCGGR